MLAWILLRQGKLKQAEDVCRKMLEAPETTDHETKQVRARALNTLGSICLNSAKFAESEKYQRQCLEQSIKLHGESHPRVVTAMNNLCHSLVRTGKFDEAERLANQALMLQEQITGKPISTCTDSLHKALAEACESRQDYAGAIKHLEIAIDAATQMFGPDHGFCNDKRALLARVQIAAGNLDDAEKTIEIARIGGNTTSAENSLEVVAARFALARGDLAAAEKLVREELERIQKITSIPSIQTVDALQVLAAVQFAQGDRPGSESTLRDAIQIVRPELNAGTPMLVSLEKDLAKILDVTSSNE